MKNLTLSATFIFLCLAVLFFCPVTIPYKVMLPVTALSVASIWLCPWQVTVALSCSALGDYFGACHNFLGQIGFFMINHIFLIWYFIKRYRTKVEPDRKVTAKRKGYIAMVAMCCLALAAVAFTQIVPGSDPGLERTGVIIYVFLILSMLALALLQRSTLFALGAVLFVFSDFILAWHKFVEPVPYRTYLVMVTYYLAQWLIFVRATPFRIKGLRLFRF